MLREKLAVSALESGLTRVRLPIPTLIEIPLAQADRA